MGPTLLLDKSAFQGLSRDEMRTVTNYFHLNRVDILIEEIVGDIYDEYDRDERDYLWINDRAVLMDAGLDIDDVNDILHSDIEDKDYDTLGGFIYDQLGAIPKGGEEFKWENLTFTIKQIDRNRISKVMVQLEEPLLGNRGDS